MPRGRQVVEEQKPWSSYKPQKPSIQNSEGIQNSFSDALSAFIDRQSPWIANSWWDNIGAESIKWRSFTENLVSSMYCCAFCGFVAFGATQKARFTRVRPSFGYTVSPYGMANVFMSKFTKDSNENIWFSCFACSTSETARNNCLHHVVMMGPAYLWSLYIEPPLQLQLLSLVDARTDVFKHYQGFVSGSLVQKSILDSPLISWDRVRVGATQELSENLKGILSHNLENNLIVRNFATISEQEHPKHGLVFVGPEIVSTIVADTSKRGPLQPMETNLLANVLFVLQDDRPPLVGIQNPRRQTVFEVGSLTMRSAVVRPRSLPELKSHKIDLEVYADGLPSSEALAEDFLSSITLETSLCPYLFPFETGFYDGTLPFIGYLKMRTSTLFSPFTLNKVYLLTMYQIRQAVVLTNQFKQMQLESSIAKFKKRTPRRQKNRFFKTV
jgi:hypothetical protein